MTDEEMLAAIQMLASLFDDAGVVHVDSLYDLARPSDTGQALAVLEAFEFDNPDHVPVRIFLDCASVLAAGPAEVKRRDSLPRPAPSASVGRPRSRRASSRPKPAR